MPFPVSVGQLNENPLMTIMTPAVVAKRSTKGVFINDSTPLRKRLIIQNCRKEGWGQ